MSNLKIYIISDDIPPTHPEFKKKWICDVLKEEFTNNLTNSVTTNILEADIVWYLAPWNYRKIPSKFKDISLWRQFLKEKYVIATIHHVDKEKYKLGEHDRIFHFTKEYVNLYHVLCNSTYKFLKNLNHNINIKLIPLWINNSDFFEIKNKKLLREKFKISKNAYLVGSFQKDTEGRKYWRCPTCFECNRDSKNKNIKCISCNTLAPEWTNVKNKLDKFEYYPKLSKGPDLFVKIVKDMKKEGKNVEVILAGVRRQYIKTQLDKLGIKYYYFEMVDLKIINELYNCLDLYLVSSRCEGGPRSIFEASITKTPIISTNVGVADFILSKDSIFDMNNYLSYKDARSNIDFAYKNVFKLRLQDYIHNFHDKLTELYDKINYNYSFYNYGNNYLLINIDSDCEKIDLKLDNDYYELKKGITLIHKKIFNNKNFSIIPTILEGDYFKIKEIKFGSILKNKIDNNKINFLLCSDRNYFVGLFSCLHSVIKNSKKISKCYFNFIVPLEDNNYFNKLIKKYTKIINVDINYNLVLVDINIIDSSIKESKCYSGGNHLLNLGNFSRLLIGEYFNYEKVLYLDSDSIVQYDIIEKLENFNPIFPLYSKKMNKTNLTLKMKSIINNNINWNEILGYNIDNEDIAYMGAPFLANLKLWNSILEKIIYIVKKHNNTENGLYKLFTMSLQNIIFYNKIGDLDKIIYCLPDCGSLRKNWSDKILSESYVLDWSGNLKPWFDNGLHKKYWDKYDILKLADNYGNTENNKKTIESFKKNTIEQEKQLIKNQSNKINIIIGTTALNRLDLHNDNIKEWSDFICANKNLNVVWFLNVDAVDKLEFTYEETVNNFKKLISNEIKLIILPKKKPEFMKSCSVVSKNIYNYIIENKLNTNKTFIMWLEDDWKLNKGSTSNINLNYFLKFLNSYSYLNLSFIRSNYIWALAPSLIGFELFKNLHYKCWEECDRKNIKGDAEHILGLHFRANILNDPKKLKTINIINNKFKRIKSGYFNQEFTKLQFSRNMIYDLKYKPRCSVLNEIFIDNVGDYIKKSYNFVRISPGWCADGVNYGRKYMASKKIKKWDKGNPNCVYNNK
tara:strand:+ start:2172 stop:5402 length:3231 start_codon:yes stop_codon:yes gene_type:complete